jgi:hypothetical protein
MNGRIKLKVNIRECFAAAPVLPVNYVVNASRIADRRMILAGYRLADLLTRVTLATANGRETRDAAKAVGEGGRPRCAFHLRQRRREGSVRVAV